MKARKVKGVLVGDLPKGPLGALYIRKLSPSYDSVISYDVLVEQGLAWSRVAGTLTKFMVYELTSYGTGLALRILREMSDEDYVKEVAPLLAGNEVLCAMCNRGLRNLGLTKDLLHMLHCCKCGHTYTLASGEKITTMPDYYLEKLAEELSATNPKTRKKRGPSKKDKAWFKKHGFDENGNELLGYTGE